MNRTLLAVLVCVLTAAACNRLTGDPTPELTQVARSFFRGAAEGDSVAIADASLGEEPARWVSRVQRVEPDLLRAASREPTPVAVQVNDSIANVHYEFAYAGRRETVAVRFIKHKGAWTITGLALPERM